MTIKTWEDRDYEAKCAELEIAQCTLKNLWARVAELEAELEKARLHIKHIGNDALRTENASLRSELAAIRAQSPEGPLVDGWQITLSDGHTGYGVYAHMTEYPDEGAIFLLAAGAQPRCPHCDGTGDVHSIDGEWRGECNCGAGAQPVPEGMALVPDAVKQDAERYQWLTADLSTADGRVERNELLSRMSVMSYSAASRDIDAAMLAAAKETK